MVGDISDLYVNSYKLMLQDRNFFGNLLQLHSAIRDSWKKSATVERVKTDCQPFYPIAQR